MAKAPPLIGPEGRIPIDIEPKLMACERTVAIPLPLVTLPWLDCTLAKIPPRAGPFDVKEDSWFPIYHS